jgi:hypothetical protein
MIFEFDEFEIIQASPQSRVVFWAFKPTNEDLTGVAVDVYRAYASTGEFAKVATVQYPQTYYVDSEINLRDFWRDANYRIESTYQGKTIKKGPQGLDSVLSVPAKEMVRLHSIDLRFSGMPVLVYLRRRGSRCPDCWDPELQKVTRSECTTCFATGYLGGYYPPILTLGNIIPEDKSNQPDVTIRESTKTSMKMSNYPLIRPRDAIREVNTPNFWRVVSVNCSEVERVITVQELTLVKLETAEIEHKLPIPDGLSFLIKPHWAKVIRKQHTFVTHERTKDPVERVEIWR